jgi:hypothetical protein
MHFGRNFASKVRPGAAATADRRDGLFEFMKHILDVAKPRPRKR